MSPAEADYLLEEWARWQGIDPLTMDWPHATSFGHEIKPDPGPSRLPIDDLRALRTDRIIARLPSRYRFLVKLHYLDHAPVDAKALRLRLGRRSYLLLIEGVCRVVGLRIDQPSKVCILPQAARLA